MSGVAVERKYSILAECPYRIAFATLSGAHLYGFPSADSDYDIRGAMIARGEAFFGFDRPPETWEKLNYWRDGFEDEAVFHDVRKYFMLLLKNNGYVLEQIFSPLVIEEGILPRLRPLAKRCITRQHWKHYCGFSMNEWTQFHRRPEKRVKRILYVFRVLLTGINLLRSGRVEANLAVLNETFKLPYIPELIGIKLAGDERIDDLPAGHSVDFYQREFERLMAALEGEVERSKLPDASDAGTDLERLLIEMRTAA